MHELKLFTALSAEESSRVLKEIAELYSNEWGKYQPDKDLNWWASYVSLTINMGGEIVCLFDEHKTLLGCVSLKSTNMEDEENFNDLTPWGSGLLVKPEARGKQYSILLGLRLMQCAQERGHKTVFFFTHNFSLSSYYARFGGEIYSKKISPTYKGQPILLLAVDVRVAQEKCLAYINTKEEIVERSRVRCR
jgi:hypothetical protein